jgi:hypothetical protein
MKRHRLPIARTSFAVLLFEACTLSQPSLAKDASAVTAAAAKAAAPGLVSSTDVAEWVYLGKWDADWEDFGYAPKGPEVDGAQVRDFSNNAGWIITTRTLDWRKLGDLTFRYKTENDFGDFLEVRVATGDATEFPRILVTPQRRVPREGWWEVRVPMSELNPAGQPFDRFRIRAVKKVSPGWTHFDRIAFLKPRGQDGGVVSARPVETIAGSFKVDCRSKGHLISPYIYGIASSHKLDAPYFELGATAGRWGGNTSSRYNWEKGNAWNAGSDWFFKNVDYSNKPGFTWRDELNHNLSKGVQTALTVPTLGWVAKDLTSYSFPVRTFGKQDESEGDMGNGMAGGRKVTPGDETQTSVRSTTDTVAKWIKTIREEDKKRDGRSSVLMYILDNEPGLWNETHRDVHNRPLTYDELFDKTVAYATAVRKAAPDALIAGPAEWGWSAYFYSALDLEIGAMLRPDQRAHGGEPIIPWWLKKLNAHQKKTGVRLLDILDVHFYPQGKGIGLMDRGGTDPATAALRIRSTRALWDPTYKDESWINETVQLIPMLKRWIADNYPGLKISIGEYNWGAEGHISGGLALAEVLGRFGESDIYSAFYWRYPPAGTPAWHAFRAFGNYDGKGSRFPSRSLSATKNLSTSVFAAKDDSSGRVVVIALNLDATRASKATIELNGCEVSPTRTFTYAGGPNGLTPQNAAPLNGGAVVQELPPYSISVLEFDAAKR